MACNPTPPFVIPIETDYGSPFVPSVPDQGTFIPVPVVVEPFDPCPFAAPIIVRFDIPSESDSLVVPILTFSVSNPEFYLVTESPLTPELDDPGWTLNQPVVYVFDSEGPKTLYAWAFNADGLSEQASDTTVITLPVPPVVDAFDIPDTSDTLLVPVLTFDVTNPDWYLLTESVDVPALDDPGWTQVKPVDYLFDSEGAKTLYAWAKNDDGLSNQLSDTTVISLVVDICGLPLSRFTFSKTISPSAQTQTINFADDGRYMYLGFSNFNLINSYETNGANWEINEQVLFGSFDVGAKWDNVWGISVKPDGSELYASGNTGLINGSIVGWSLPTSYLFDDDAPDIPVEIGSYPISNIGGIIRISDINIKPDGTRLLGWGNDGPQNLYELDMPAWTIGSMTYNSVKSSQSATSAFVTANGNCLYKGNGSIIERFGFGAPWDTTTLGPSPEDTLDVSAQVTTIRGLYVTEDRLFVISEAGDIHQYDA